jgi:hypothetical protein
MNNMFADPPQVTLRVIRVFDQLGIPYLIGGSLSSAVHGVIRSTLDADIVADIHLEHVDRLVDLLHDEFYIDAEMVRTAIWQNNSFNLIHFDTAFKVDVFLLKQRPFDQNQMQRRVLQQLGSPSEKAYFSTAEDIILAKLQWYRNGGEVSERQWRDILGVLGYQADHINKDYLQYWAKNLQVDSLLERALKESGII